MHIKDQFGELVLRLISCLVMAALAIITLVTPLPVRAQSTNIQPMRIYLGAIVTVDSHAGPWLPVLNPAYEYGFHDNGNPTIVNQANSGIKFTAGTLLTITYLSGLASAGGALPFTDANGDTTSAYGCGPGLTDPPTGKRLPCDYGDLSKKTYLMALLGVFTDSNGVIVGKPFTIGDGPFQVAIPAGATQLQMGVTDDIYYDNMGSWAIQVTHYGPTACSL